MLVDRGLVADALPGYQLGDQIGSGGFGLVLAGWQTSLQRDVAIKVLAAGGGPRFDAAASAEARILAGLDHPHIVRVFDYCEAAGLRMIVMERLAGGTLTQRRATLGPDAVCAVGLAVADALSCAHARGVLHRDIKPDNVMFDTSGVLKVVDFGIAKLVGSTPVTASAVVGTPLFMAPEQLAGGRLGPATDLYGLAMLLHFLLADRPDDGVTVPFGSPAAWAAPPRRPSPRPLSPPPDSRQPVSPGPRSRGSMSSPVRPGPTTPGPLPPEVPQGVSDVIFAALAPDLGDRPDSAHVFALALARAAADAYGPTWIARSGIPIRLSDDVRAAAERPSRHAWESLAMVGETASPPGTSKSALTDPRPADQRPANTDQIGGAGEAGETAEGASKAGKAGAARRRAGTRPWRSGRNRRWTVRVGAAAVVAGLAVTGTLLLIGAGESDGGRVQAVRLIGKPLTGHTNWVAALAFAPDGRTLASGSKDGTVRFWDISDPERPRSLGSTSPPTAGVLSVAYSPQGNTLALGNWDGTEQLWDVHDPSHPRRIPASFSKSASTVNWLAFNADGQRLFDGTRAGIVRAWDMADARHPRLVSQLSAGSSSVDWVRQAIDPIGAYLASSGQSGGVQRVRLWWMSDGPEPQRTADLATGHSGPVYGMAISPDLRTLATGSKDTTIRLWDMTNPSSPRLIGQPLRGHTSSVWAVAFAPSAALFASGSFDGTVRLWDLRDRTSPRPLGGPLTGHTDFVQAVAFSPDSRLLASAGRDNTIRLWRVPEVSAH
ncbi:serine/threonine protein kinase [Frankia sp. AiPa1]|nr:serine/threonine protein kinase [Frankia sp. AiPa1]